MNILDRMESRLAENKSAFKTYATVKAAAQAVEKKIAQVAAFHDAPRDIHYTVVFLPSVSRYAVMVNHTDWLRRYGLGGYGGEFNVSGFWSQ